MDSENKYFFTRANCPFCMQKGTVTIPNIAYRDTAEANPEIPSVTGHFSTCSGCGIAYSSHGPVLEEFAKFYEKSLVDHKYLNESIMQKLRTGYLKAILRGYYSRYSFSRVLDLLSLRVFNVPHLTKRPKGLRILDVGCGLGEFMIILKELNNEVAGTEVVPFLSQRLTQMGLECREGEIEGIQFQPSERKFDLILLRAVFYRTRNPRSTLETLRDLLAPDGEIALVDPCPKNDGLKYFARKQFPQGHFYICDPQKYLTMLKNRFNLECVSSRITYGRPESLLKKTKIWGIIAAFFELFIGNLLGRKPYLLCYTLKKSKSPGGGA